MRRGLARTIHPRHQDPLSWPFPLHPTDAVWRAKPWIDQEQEPRLNYRELRNELGTMGLLPPYITGLLSHPGFLFEFLFEFLTMALAEGPWCRFHGWYSVGQHSQSKGYMKNNWLFFIISTHKPPSVVSSHSRDENDTSVIRECKTDLIPFKR